jgi:putative tryptophan/tyrosine transport system substrate-binding protein
LVRAIDRRPFEHPLLSMDGRSRRVAFRCRLRAHPRARFPRACEGRSTSSSAKAATSTIPIVFTVPEDPVQLGLVASLSQPGGNLTGVNLFVGELVPKRLELLRELVPAMTRVAVFVNPANPVRAELHVREVESAGRAMGLRIQIFNTGTVREINAAFATLARERPDALFVSPDPYFVVRRVQIATLAAHHAIPTSFSTREPVEAGGLISYGTKILDAYRQTGLYAGRVLVESSRRPLPRAIYDVLEGVVVDRGQLLPTAALRLVDAEIGKPRNQSRGVRL